MTHRGGRIAGIIALVLGVGAVSALSAGRPHLAAPERRQHCRPPPARCCRSTRCGASHAGIFDSAGRQVRPPGREPQLHRRLLPGQPVVPHRRCPSPAPTGTRWPPRGSTSVRLLVNWSRLEPTKGIVDPGYLALDPRHGRRGRRRGASTRSSTCTRTPGASSSPARPPSCARPACSPPSAGTARPQWATITDGADTCNDGTRENSEAVRTAWDSFYSNRDGIRTELVHTWHAVAQSFAGDPAVAGYDLLNEPDEGHDVTASMAGLTTYYQQAIAAIRCRREGRRRLRPADHVRVQRQRARRSRRRSAPTPAWCSRRTTTAARSRRRRCR